MRDLANFIFETAMLRRIKRSGPFMTGSLNHENVAEHCHRAMIIGYIIAVLEKANPDKVLKLLLIHDLAEARIWDYTKVLARYIDMHPAESKAFKEQMQHVPEKVAQEWEKLHEEFEARKTKEAIVARDADSLECAFEAKELVEQGYKGMQNWIERIREVLKTKSAQELLDTAITISFNDWWHGLKKPPQK